MFEQSNDSAAQRRAQSIAAIKRRTEHDRELRRQQIDEPLSEELYTAWRRERRKCSEPRMGRRALARVGSSWPPSCNHARNARAPRRVHVVRRVSTSSSADDPGGGSSDSDGPPGPHIARCASEGRLANAQ